MSIYCDIIVLYRIYATSRWFQFTVQVVIYQNEKAKLS